MSILIVDDAAFMRTILKDILTNNGYTICGEANDGLDAIQKAKELKPNLITMDITMPQLDGIEALKQIKADNPNVKVVMCSAMGQQALVVEAIQSGACDFIVKPFNKARVIEAVSKAIG